MMIRHGQYLCGTIPRNHATLLTRFDAFEIAHLKSAVEPVIGMRIASLKPIADGVGSVVFGTESDRQGPGYIVKVGVFSDTHSPAEEVLYLRNCGLRRSLVPTALSLDVSGSVIPFPWFVMTRMPGISLASAAASLSAEVERSLTAQYAVALAHEHSHALSTTGFGRLGASRALALLDSNSEDARPTEAPQTQASFLFDHVLAAVDEFSAPLSKFENLQSCIERLHPLKSHLVSTSYLHGDPSTRNVLTNKKIVTGLIDGPGVATTPLDEVANAVVFIWVNSGRAVHPAKLTIIDHFLGTYFKHNTAFEYATFDIFEALLSRHALRRSVTAVKLGHLDTLRRLETFATHIKGIASTLRRSLLHD
ncbi:MAG: aminoglycoside phosphotransferase family protein [Phycisphaerales bacterium]|nr:aminoglycoside phosphotransferase family protein [Phycisphaerales bacterium]MCB9856978.1 aminoglycoside phosphotransferase family protein [Phycisphaerales bacterium]MCB9861895.1 aminoglycoside phosphotransferase family protein [Phycisphaerales bacterium]